MGYQAQEGKWIQSVDKVSERSALVTVKKADGGRVGYLVPNKPVAVTKREK